MKPSFHELAGSTAFYFIRHGQSEANLAGRMQGRTESALTEAGRAQAARSAEFFRDLGISRVLCSPLLRTQETARLVCAGAGLPEAELLEDLQELDIGVFSNLMFKEVSTTHTAAWNAFQAQGWEGVPEAESIAELQARAGRVWARLIQEANMGHSAVLCVSHGGFLQWMVKQTFGTNDQGWSPMIEIQNCGILMLDARPVKAVEPGQDPSYFAIWRHLNYQVTE